MDLKYQIAIAASSCFVGILVGIFIVRAARRKFSRRKSSPSDDINTLRRRSSNLANRHVVSPRDNPQTDENIFEPARTHVELETFSEHRQIRTREDRIVHPVLSTNNRSMEPTVDYPVTPLISRQTSMPSRPVTIPQDHPVTTSRDHHDAIPLADYSDDDTLLDVPVAGNVGAIAIDKQKPRRPGLTRTTSYPVSTHPERNINTRRSERNHLTNYSHRPRDMDPPITDRVTHFQTPTGYPGTIPSSRDGHVMHATRHHHETQPLPDYPSFELVQDIPHPDYH